MRGKRDLKPGNLVQPHDTTLWTESLEKGAEIAALEMGVMR